MKTKRNCRFNDLCLAQVAAAAAHFCKAELAKAGDLIRQARAAASQASRSAQAAAAYATPSYSHGGHGHGHGGY